MTALRSIERRRPLVSLLLAGMISALALLAKGLLLQAGIESHFQFLFAAVALSAVLLGPLAGLTTTGILAFVNIALFAPSVGSPATDGAAQAGLTVLFLLNGLLVSGLSYLLTRHRDRALERAAALAGSEARFRSVFETHPNPLLVVDESGTIRFANEEAASVFGYESDELVGLRVDRLVPGSFREVQQRNEGPLDTDAAVRLDPGDVELRGRRRDGTEFPVDVAVRSYRDQGRRFFVAAVVDRSAQDHADELRRQFIYVLSHELRTPVTTIYGAAQVLLRKGRTLDPDVARDLLEGVAEQSDRLHRMVENLLVVARVERGVETSVDEPVLLQRLLPALIERERHLWPGVEFHLAIPSDLPVLQGDEGSLTLLLDNLVSNAAKYGGTVGRVEIEAVSRNGGVEVSIADAGPGMDPRDLPYLFDLFYRANRTERIAPGSGIGLYVARTLAQAMGGTISAANRPSGGAVFTLRLLAYGPVAEPGRRVRSGQTTAVTT
jgi:PAS domain S-box-containing protein